MSEVVIVRKRDAKTNPPEVAGNHVTDQGCLYWNFDGWLHDSDRIADPQPLWWYDLRPTEGEGLTTEDLRAVLHMLALDWDDWCKLPAETQNYYNTVSPRLRAALDALTKEVA